MANFQEPQEQQMVGRTSRRTLLQAASAGVVASAAGAVVAVPALYAQGTTPVSRPNTIPQGGLMSQATPMADAPLTVVLVHGAFADASGWAGIIERLQAAGVAVMAPANPLRSVSGDAAYTASVVSQIPGPVLLVGHSYGGMVISNAAPMADNVVGLVYVCAFIPDEGESILALSEHATDSLLGTALVPRQFPNGPGEEPGVELYIDVAKFHEVFAADLPAEQAAVMAVSQRPGSAAGFGEPSGPVGWKTLPSWAIISPNDVTIGPAGEKLMAERSGATITEIDGSHVLFIAQPDAVTEVIMTAVEAVSS